MHRGEDDDSSSYLRPPGICRRLLRFVVAKLGILGEKEKNEDKPERNKLIKKGSRSDITIHFKQIEDSEDNSKCKNNFPGSSSQDSERETMNTLANGGNGPKKRLHVNGKKSTMGEPSPKQLITQPEAGKPPQPEAGKTPQPHRRLRPHLNDINKKSDAFIESTLEKMRKSLA